MKKRILLTINPCIIRNRELTSMRNFITVLDRHFDLVILPIDGYDFDGGLVRAYKRLQGGAFRSIGQIEPEGDLWMVYTDGYYLNHKRYGFQRRRDFFDAQIEFHQRFLGNRSVARMVNTPDAELRTLKSWFATLDFRKACVIPTYTFSRIDGVYDFQRRERNIVVKPIWGGAATEVQWLGDEDAVRKFHSRLSKRQDRDMNDYCFQVYREGPEKRLWFAGNNFITGRKYGGRGVPWRGWSDPCSLTAYNRNSHIGFAEDLAAARYVRKLSGISVGSIDFIGNQINEVNGAGTVMAEVNGHSLFVDARPGILKYLIELMNSL